MIGARMSLRWGTTVAVAVATLLSGGCQGIDPGLALEITIPLNAVAKVTELDLVFTNPGGALGMETAASPRPGIRVSADGSSATVTLTSPFAFKDDFQILLQPTGTTPLSLDLVGRIFGMGAELGTGMGMALIAKHDARTTGKLDITCNVPSCALVQGVIDLAASPPTVVEIDGDAGGDKLQPLTVGRFTAGGVRGDLVLASPGKTYMNRTQSGVVYVFKSLNWQVPGFVRSYTASSADITIVGKEGDSLGSAAFTADLDGDGIDDLAVGGTSATAPSCGTSSCAATGVVYFITGRKLAAGPLIDLNDAATFAQTPKVYGAVGQERLGSAISAAHVSSSSFHDIFLGAPGGVRPSDGAKVGLVYVLRALFANPPAQLLLSTAGDGVERVLGPSPGTPIGVAIATGDVDGDGKAELAIGNFADGNKGSVYLLDGARLAPNSSADMGAPDSGAASAMIDLTTSFDARVVGTSGSLFGWTVAFGDLEGKGTLDLVVGARGASAVYVFASSKLGAGANLDVAQSQFSLAISGAAGASFGNAVALGNLDGDALDDLVIGAPAVAGPDGTRTNGGAAYVVLAAQLGDLSGSRAFDLSGARAVIYGGQMGDGLGGQVALGTFDNSMSTSQVIAGAESGGMNSQGAVYALDSLPAQ